MKNLESYRIDFDTEFANYSDNKYSKIRKLVDALPSDLVVHNILESSQAISIEAILSPLIEIRNYKSQTPFTNQPFEAIKLITKLKNIKSPGAFGPDVVSIFNSFFKLGGFRLPTISAIFHFCHCDNFPIVDRNIEAACADFAEQVNMEAPKLLSGKKNDDKKNLEIYKQFISFLGELKKVHNDFHETKYSYRDLDKSLMVYGAEKLRNNKKPRENN